MSMTLVLAEPAVTDALAQALAHTRPACAVVYLQGDLGAGKTTLARALLRALGVQGAIKSPTYALIERYPLAQGEAVHMDLYRIASADELDFLGLDEVSQDAALWLVEWPERAVRALPKADLRIALSVLGEGRKACLEALSAAGEAWLSRLTADAGLAEPS